ncbi:hypothetical protein [Flavobacterium sp. U410]
MEPNKFEQIAKEKLAKREIQPSVAAWDRLDAMLTAQEQPKKKNNLWLYIAASLFLVLGIGFWNMRNDTNSIIIPKQKMVNSEENQQRDIDTEKNQKVMQRVDQSSEIAFQNKTEKKSGRQVVLGEKNKEIEKKNIIQLTDKQQLSNLDKEAQVEENKYQYVTPEELLASVDQKYTGKSETQKTRIKSSLKVNPDELLTAAEEDIKVEYRENTLDKLQRNYSKVKSALASRNYQE